MELSDYIKLTLDEIAEGVRKANESLGKDGGRVLTGTRMVIEGVPFMRELGDIVSPIIQVSFRVGVEVEEQSKKGGKLNGSLKVVSTDIETIKKDGRKSIQEITFEVPLILPAERGR